MSDRLPAQVPLEVLGMEAESEADLARLGRQYAPVPIEFDDSRLTPRQLRMLVHLFNAADIMDDLFWRQASTDGRAIYETLADWPDPPSRHVELLRRYVRINYGRFDRLGGFAPFIGDSPAPLGAAFYPPEMTREDLEAFVAANPEVKDDFESEFTVIRGDRDDEGRWRLRAVPYSEYYHEELTAAAAELREAARLSDNESLARFLRSRADAFLSNDYFASDLDWMDLEGNLIDVTIGPYEVYEDRLLNSKAAFQAFITINDPKAAAALEKVTDHLSEMERNLPIPDEHKSFERGEESPIRVADVIYTSGDTRAGVQTLAFVLPNDERVRAAKGTKKVLLRNIFDAKFAKILEPIAERVVAADQLRYLSHEAYFNHTLMHEVSHGLGPGNIVTADGTATTVNRALRELYSPIEEAKADILAIYNTFFLIDAGVLPPELERQMAVTTMAGTFRSVRFGATGAHGLANMIVMSFLMNEGAYLYGEESERFRVDFDRLRPAVEKLAHEILMVQALGDYEGAKRLIEDYGRMPPPMVEALERLGDIPVDIQPIFAAEERFL